MLEMTLVQIEVVRADPLFSAEVVSRLPDPSVARKPAVSLSEHDWNDLHDACLEILTNEAPLVESFDAEQSKGVYSVTIRGIPGAYFVSAIEYDDSGIFSTLEDARALADSAHGEFRVSDGAGRGMEEDNEEWLEPDPREPAFPERLLRIISGSDAPEVLDAVRSRIEADESFVMFANGVAAPHGCTPRPEVFDFVTAFEESLPSPQSAISGMARSFNKLPRLRLRVELFLRLNGRMPDPAETSELYVTE
jgi:hypothetical protein